MSVRATSARLVAVVGSTLLWAMLLSLMVSCGGSHKSVKRPSVEPKQLLTVRFKSTMRTNAGNPFYALVRTVDSKSPPTIETYQEASARIFVTPPDPSVVASEPVIPGTDAEVEVDLARVDGMLLYFFFTAPGGNWRVPVQPPFPKVIEVTLGDDRVDGTQFLGTR